MLLKTCDDHLTAEELRVIEAYSKGSRGYESAADSMGPLINLIAELGIDSLRQSLQMGQRVLDVGCGVGSFVPILDSLYMEYDGIDPAEGMIQIARQKHPGKKFHQLDIESLPLAFQPGTFHAFLCMSSLMFLPPERMTAALKKLRVVIKYGGCGLLCLTNFGNKDTVSLRQDEGGFVELRFYRWTTETFEPHLRNAGFNILEDYSQENASLGMLIEAS